MKINEISLNELIVGYGNINKFIALCQLGTKNMKNVIALQELIIEKINNEINNKNFLLPKIVDKGFLFNKSCLEVSILITINKNEIDNDLHNIFVNTNDFINFLCYLCDNHNVTAKKMNIYMPYYKSDCIKLEDDVLGVFFLLHIL